MKFHNTNLKILLLITSVFFTGCASIVSKSDYPVSISSQPTGAKFIITDKSGSVVFSGETPTTTILSASAGFWQGAEYIVKFEKDGYISREVQIKRGIDGWYIGGNLLFGGLIGWLIVDPATGSMWTLEKNVYANLAPETSSLDNSASSLKLASLSDLPHPLRDHLVPINK